MGGFLSVAIRKYRVPALLGAVLTGICCALASQVVPPLYPSTAEVMVMEPIAVHRLANPFAPLPSARHELAEVPEILRSRDQLVAIVKRTGLVDQWAQGRPWPLKLKDALMERLRGPLSEKDRLEALVAMVEKRYHVSVEGNRVRISAEWGSPQLAKAIVENGIGTLTQLRTQREGTTLQEAADALDRQLETVRTEMNARAARVEQMLKRPDGWSQAEAEREQLMRESYRAAELMVGAEEKRITAEVFRQSNSLRFTVVRPALEAREPAGPGPLARGVLGVLASVLAGLMTAVLLALGSRRLLSAGQVRDAVALPVLAGVRFPGPAIPGRLSRRGAVLLLAMSALTGAAFGLSNANPVAAVGPPLVFLGLYLAWTRPLKWPLLGVMLLSVTLDDPTDRAYVGLWQSPFSPLGKLFFRNIAFFTGVELCILGLVALAVARRLVLTREERARLDPVDGRPPTPLAWGLVLSAAFIGWLIVLGLARGGDFREALWQFRHLLMLPLVAFLVIEALEFPKDLRKLLAVLVIGSLLKSVLGIIFMYGVALPMGELPPHTTGHNDTMIFVTAVVTAVTLFWEKASRRHFALLVLWLPLVAVALKLNDRRIAYVDIVMALTVIYLMSPMHEMKRKLTRAAIAIAPLVLLYTAVGWNQLNSRAFAPVQKIRSIVAPTENSEEESSNVERDIENYNLMKSWEQNMVFGQGFGHAFHEFVPSNDFRQSAFGHIGHNSILWLLWIGGVFGFTGVLGYLAVALYFAGRTLRLATDYRERAALLVALGIVVTYLMQAFGDMGTQATMFDFFVGTAVALIGRLATKHRVWRAQPLVAAPATPAQNPVAVTV